MKKKQIAKNYIEERVNFKELKDKINNDPWLKKQSVGLLACNGLVINYFDYNLTVEAIAIAGYKHPRNDRTWDTMHDIRVELLEKYL